MASVTIRKRKKKKGYSYQLIIDYSTNHSDMDYMSFDSFEEARQAKAEIENQLNKNIYIKQCKYTFSELLDKWHQNHVSSSCYGDTNYGYGLINEKYLKPILGHIPIKNITVEILDNYFKYIRIDEEGPHLSFQTAKNHKTNISGALSYAVKNRWIAENICKQSTIPKDQEKTEDYIEDISNINDIDDLNTDKKQALTLEQCITVLNLFKNSCLLLPVSLAMFLNLRRSEICGLLNQKVNFDKKILLVNSIMIRGIDGLEFKKRNKNKTSTRAFYIPNVLLEIMKFDQNRKSNNKDLVGDKYIESDFLCTLDDGTPLKPDYLSRHFSATINNYIEQNVKINPEFKFPKITLHELRHSNITLLLENGINLVDVKNSAGHSDINTTMIYTHTYNNNKKQIADKVDEIFSPLLAKNNF